MFLINPYRFFDSTAADYIAAVEAADGQGLENGVKNAIKDFVAGCKNDGIWNAIKASCILAGARTLNGALVPLVGTAPTNNNFVAGDYNRKTGLKGNASTKFLNTNRNNNADPQNNQHLSVYASEASTSLNSQSSYPVYIGVGRSDSGSTQFARNGNANLYARNRSNTPLLDIGAGASVGLIAMSRSSSSEFFFRVGQSTARYSSTSQTPYSANLYVYKDNYPSFDDTNSNARLAFYSIGESLDLAFLDTRVTALINALTAAIP